MKNDATSRGHGALLLLAILSLGAARLADRTPGGDMSRAAQRFLEELSPELRAKASLAFDDKARRDWHFVPRSRPGVTFGEMNDAQRTAARGLIRAALSARGSLKVEEIMTLEGILREVDKGTADEALRDPNAYTVAVYGEPMGGTGGAGVRWGWKLEGHHISLNFTLPRDDRVDATPAFFGASPAQVRQGPRAGLRVLALEEDLARALVRSLDDAQRREAVLAGVVPSGILTGPGRSLDEVAGTGLTYASMTEPQKQLLDRLLDEYAGNLRHELAADALERIRKAGVETIRFAWAGSVDPGRPHYYRISGPTFVIEYDNTQNSANHIHTVWHDRERDFGRDLLKEHYEQGHKRE